MEMLTNPAAPQCWMVAPARSWVRSLGMVALLCASVSPSARAVLPSCGKAALVFFPVTLEADGSHGTAELNVYPEH